jgi:tetratricopeptide (TPR) repeat protein
VLLVLAACVSTWQAVRATRAERQALAERDRAEASFQMARDTVDRFFTQVGESPKLKAQGMEKFRRDLLQNAKEFYERFIRQQLDAPQVRHDLGLAHYRLAKIQEVLGDFAAAEALSEKAIEILGELARTHADVVDYHRDLAASHFELGAVYSDRGRFEKADSAYQQALAIQEKLAEDHPQTAEYRRALATTQAGLGALYLRAGPYEKAQASLEKGLATWTQLVGTNSPVQEDRYGLASAQQRLGSAYVQRGQSEKAQAMLKEAASTYQALVADYPDIPEYRHSLGHTYRALGGVYFNNLRQLEKAQAAQEQALQVYEKLAQEHPDVWEYACELARCHYNLALGAQAAGRLDAALTSGDKAVEILQQVVGKGYGEVRADLFDVWLLRAFVLAGRCDHARATKEANAVARQEGLGNVNHYNIACVFALSSAAAEKDSNLSPADRTRLKAQYADRAIEFLRQAVSKGYQNAASLKTDPDLAALRSREDFKKLVQEVEQKSTK